MNLFQLVLKQMRQRALGTSLTLLSVVLGVALAVAVLLVRRGGESLFGQTDYGYDLIVGKGSPMQLVLNTVYHIENSPGNVPYSLYEQLARDRRQVKQAIPVAVGDTFKRRRVVGTTPQMFGYNAEGERVQKDEDAFHYRPGKRFKIADGGTVFHARKFEAVVGSDVPELAGLKVGDTFNPTHGAPAEGQKAHEHGETWRVVGVLEPTNTSNDRVIFIPLVTTFCIEEHSEGMAIQSNIRAAQAGQPVTMPSRVPGQLPRQLPGQLRPVLPGRSGLPPLPIPATGNTPVPAPGGDLLSSDAPAKDAHDEHDDHDTKDDHGAHDEHPAPAPPAGAPAGTPPAGNAHNDERDKHEAHGTHDAHADHDAVAHHEQAGGEGSPHEHEAYTVNADGTIEPKLPKEQWLLSAILVKARAPFMAQTLEYGINAGSVATAVKPAMVMSQFFDTILAGSTLVLLLISGLVSIVAAVGILVSIYNSVSARKREIAVLRALGATKARVLTLICVEAGLIGLVGGVVGWLLGHGIGAIASAAMDRVVGQGFNWVSVGWEEVAYLAGVVAIAVLAGLVPAMKAYRTPVATNLVAG